MKSKFLLATAVLAVLSTPAYAGSFTLEGIALTRDDFENDNLIRTTAGDPIVFANDLDIEWTGGARATLESEFWGHDWQLSAFFVAPEKSHDQFGDVSGTFLFNSEYTYFDDLNADGNSRSAEIFGVETQWETWGAEFNWVKGLMSGLNGILGVRYINFRDKLVTITFDEVNDFLGTDNDIDRVSITATNNLAGIQIGLEGEWNLFQDLNFGASLKGGVAANFAMRHRSFSSDNNILNLRSDSIDETGFAQFAEFNPTLTFKFNESASLVVGGNVLWLNDISEASPHYATAGLSTDTNIRDDQDVLLYGATIGLKIATN